MIGFIGTATISSIPEFTDAMVIEARIDLIATLDDIGVGGVATVTENMNVIGNSLMQISPEQDMNLLAYMDNTEINGVATITESMNLIATMYAYQDTTYKLEFD